MTEYCNNYNRYYEGNDCLYEFQPTARGGKNKKSVLFSYSERKKNHFFFNEK